MKDIYERTVDQCGSMIKASETEWSISVLVLPEDWEALHPDPEEKRPEILRNLVNHAVQFATGCNVVVIGDPTKDGGTITVCWRDGTSAQNRCIHDDLM